MVFEYLPIAKASRVLRVSQATLYALARARKIHSRENRETCAWLIRVPAKEYFFSPKMLATSMDCTDRYIRKLCKEKVLIAQKIGVQWRIPLDEATKLMLRRLRPR